VLEVDLVTTRRDWVAVLEQMDAHDYCHSYDFHHISSQNGEGDPIMFAVRDSAGRYVFCWPALWRAIPETSWPDLTSVYGYGGPLATNATLARASLERVLDSMRDLGAVSLFSRMHPIFIDQLPDDPAVRGELLGDVVVIDTRSQPDPITSYRSDHRRGIKRALKAGITTEIDAEGKRMDEFLALYREAMDFVGADDYYYFDKDYFSLLKEASDFQSVITFAQLGGKEIAAGLSLITNDIMHAYLGGSLPEYRKLAPMKVITAAEHEFAVSNGFGCIVLGGGLGLADDHLLKFKRGFSNNLKPFSVYKNILNKNIYEELCSSVGVSFNADGYFPAYRGVDRQPD